MTAWPVISQNAADSVKVSRLDLISAAEELEDFDQLKTANALTLKILGTYKAETTALRLQNSTKAAQIELLNRAYNMLKTENDARKAQAKPKFSLLDGAALLAAFFAGAFATTL